MSQWPVRPPAPPPSPCPTPAPILRLVGSQPGQSSKEEGDGQSVGQWGRAPGAPTRPHSIPRYLPLACLVGVPISWPVKQTNSASVANDMETEYGDRSPLKTSENPPSAEGYGNAAPPTYSQSEGGGVFADTLDDTTIRRMFIRKVFAILSMQLLFTFGIVCIFTYSTDIQAFVLKTPALYYSSFGIFIFVLVALSCCGDFRRMFPWNLLFLAILTLSLSYMVGVIASTYSTSSVMIALGSTVAVCFAVILFASQTRFDFTLCYGFLLVASIILFMFGFFSIFFYSRIMEIVYGSLGALIFSIFLAADIQLILAKHRYSLSPEEYIFGALILYLDIINIFLYILMIIGGDR
ncbi:protein lifeguard 1 [Carcharodon carcharias]|uniref:protein lifeguard 1 n=1 Tax=Carcharodon carcharias TaxID=13397 RepID=UPI001B7EE758|nr:protein lifeguard 1 [Carcharodon carcharias]